MVESFIQVPPDSTGKRIRSIEKIVAGNVVHEEVFNVSNPRRLIGVYQYASPMVTGSTTAGYVYHSLLYPSTATRLLAVRRIVVVWGARATSVGILGSVWRITSATGGTARAVTDVSKKDTTYPNPVIDIRDTGVTVTLAQRVLNIFTPVSVESSTGIFDLNFTRDDGRSDIILRPGEGLCLRQEDAGDIDFRVAWTVEWEEFEGVTVLA